MALVREDNLSKRVKGQQLCKLNGSFVDLIKETHCNWAAIKSLKYPSWRGQLEILVMDLGEVIDILNTL